MSIDLRIVTRLPEEMPFLDPILRSITRNGGVLNSWVSTQVSPAEKNLTVRCRVGNETSTNRILYEIEKNHRVAVLKVESSPYVRRTAGEAFRT